MVIEINKVPLSTQAMKKTKSIENGIRNDCKKQTMNCPEVLSSLECAIDAIIKKVQQDSMQR